MASVLNLAHVEVLACCPQGLSSPWSVWDCFLQAPMGNIPPGSTGPTWFRRKVILLAVSEAGA